MQLTSLLGREHELATLRQLLYRRDARLVTITGPPGVGKTSLALTSAHAVPTHYDVEVSKAESIDKLFLAAAAPPRTAVPLHHLHAGNGEGARPFHPTIYTREMGRGTAVIGLLVGG